MIKILSYKGKDYPVRIGYYAIKHTSALLKAKTGKELTMENLFTQDLEVYEPLLFFSLEMGAKATDKKLDLKLEDMEFMLDEVLFDFVEMVPEFFPKQEEGATVKGNQLSPPKK